MEFHTSRRGFACRIAARLSPLVIAVSFAVASGRSPAASYGAELGWNPERTWVFAVGILEWQHPDIWAGFPAAVKNRADVRFIHRLREHGVPDEQIVFLKDKQATKARIHAKFGELLDQTEEGDLLIFYFAGHGYRDRETNQTWFAQYDAGKKHSSGWPVKNVFKMIENRFSGDRALLLADCCHSGALYDEVKRRSEAEIGYAAITSSYSHNSSTGSWTFTDSLVKAFDGRPTADYDGDNFVELDEAARYISGEMAFVEGQKSMFTASADFAANTKVARSVGKALPKAGSHCEAFSEGDWFKAEVLEYDAASNQYKVHYLDYSAEFDEWLEASKVRAYRPPQYAVGAIIEARDDEGKWYPAVVRHSWYGLHLVHYDNYDDTWDEWLGPGRVRPRK